MPRNPSEIETSLEIIPTMPTAMAYGVTCLPPAVKKSRYCASPTSMPPPPLPMMTPALGGDLAGKRRDVEFGDGSGGSDAAADVVPEPLPPNTERRDDADARDHDPRDGHGLTIIPADA